MVRPRSGPRRSARRPGPGRRRPARGGPAAGRWTGQHATANSSGMVSGHGEGLVDQRGGPAGSAGSVAASCSAMAASALPGHSRTVSLCVMATACSISPVARAGSMTASRSAIAASALARPPVVGNGLGRGDGLLDHAGGPRGRRRPAARRWRPVLRRAPGRGWSGPRRRLVDQRRVRGGGGGQPLGDGGQCLVAPPVGEGLGQARACSISAAARAGSMTASRSAMAASPLARPSRSGMVWATASGLVNQHSAARAGSMTASRWAMAASPLARHCGRGWLGHGNGPCDQRGVLGSAAASRSAMTASAR